MRRAASALPSRWTSSTKMGRTREGHHPWTGSTSDPLACLALRARPAREASRADRMELRERQERPSRCARPRQSLCGTPSTGRTTAGRPAPVAIHPSATRLARELQGKSSSDDEPSSASRRPSVASVRKPSNPRRARATVCTDTPAARASAACVPWRHQLAHELVISSVTECSARTCPQARDLCVQSDRLGGASLQTVSELRHVADHDERGRREAGCGPRDLAEECEYDLLLGERSAGNNRGGVSGGLPCAIRASARGPSRAQAHEDDERARRAGERGEVEGADVVPWRRWSPATRRPGA